MLIWITPLLIRTVARSKLELASSHIMMVCVVSNPLSNTVRGRYLFSTEKRNRDTNIMTWHSNHVSSTSSKAKLVADANGMTSILAHRHDHGYAEISTSSQQICFLAICQT